MFRIFRSSLMPALAILPLLWAQPTSGQTVVYDNTTTLTGIVQFNGATNFSGNTLTAMVADDLTLSSGSGGKTITSGSFGLRIGIL